MVLVGGFIAGTDCPTTTTQHSPELELWPFVPSFNISAPGLLFLSSSFSCNERNDDSPSDEYYSPASREASRRTEQLGERMVLSAALIYAREFQDKSRRHSSAAPTPSTAIASRSSAPNLGASRDRDQKHPTAPQSDFGGARRGGGTQLPDGSLLRHIPKQGTKYSGSVRRVERTSSGRGIRVP